MSRSGDEPAHARSPLRLRLGLALFGLACGVVGVLLFAATGHGPLVVLFAALGVVAAVDAGVVVTRIRQGPHWQPGPDVPPYRPVASEQPERKPPRQPVPVETRLRQYLLLMTLCLTLLLVAWIVLRPLSTTAAVLVTLAAMALPPTATLLANRKAR